MKYKHMWYCHIYYSTNDVSTWNISTHDISAYIVNTYDISKYFICTYKCIWF